MIKISDSLRDGFMQSLGVTVYIALIGLFMGNANTLFGKMNNFSAPILMLLLLSISVLICGLLVFYKPYKLFFADKKKEAIETVLYTTLGLFIILILFLLAMLVFKV